MAPVKPMGTDKSPKTKPGVTGFYQEYNQEAAPAQDLNPDAVTEGSVLPESQTRASRGGEAKARKPRGSAPKAGVKAKTRG
jgi:hypothetical protein